MAKKIKFALEMADGAKVRILDDLREHFDLEKAIEYFLSGKLIEWLEDRRHKQIAEALRSLDNNSPDFKEQLCATLGVAYKGEDVSLTEIESVTAKRTKLKQLTSDEEIIAHAAETAFSQEELDKLLDTGIKTIYLCGEEFHLPTKVSDCCYIGILSEPKVNIDIESMDSLAESNIVLEHVRLPEHLQTSSNSSAYSFAKHGKQAENPSVFSAYLENIFFIFSSISDPVRRMV